MADYQHADWAEQPTKREQYTKLGQFMTELADFITVDVEADGLKKLSSPVRLLYASLISERKRLEQELDSAGRRGRVRMTFVR